MRRRLWWGATFLILVPVAAAVSCAIRTTPVPEADDRSATAAVTVLAGSGPDCLAPQVLAALGFDRDEHRGATVHDDAPEAGPVPTGFSPVLAVTCATGETLTDSSGRWDAVTATRYEGELTGLTQALADQVTAEPSPSGSCLNESRRVDLWLADAAGNTIRVAVPGAVCGDLPESAWAELDALTPVDVESYPVRLVAATASAAGSATG